MPLTLWRGRLAGAITAPILARVAQAPVPAPVPVVAGALVNAVGGSLALRGVNFSGAQYECLDGASVGRSGRLPGARRASPLARQCRAPTSQRRLLARYQRQALGQAGGELPPSRRAVGRPPARERDRRLAQPPRRRARQADLPRRSSHGRRRPRTGVLVVRGPHISSRPFGAVRPLQRGQADLMELLARRLPAPLRNRRNEQAHRIDPRHRRDPARRGRRPRLRH